MKKIENSTKLTRFEAKLTKRGEIKGVIMVENTENEKSVLSYYFESLF